LPCVSSVPQRSVYPTHDPSVVDKRRESNLNIYPIPKKMTTKHWDEKKQFRNHLQIRESSEENTIYKFYSN